MNNLSYAESQVCIKVTIQQYNCSLYVILGRYALRDGMNEQTSDSKYCTIKNCMCAGLLVYKCLNQSASATLTRCDMCPRLSVEVISVLQCMVIL